MVQLHQKPVSLKMQKNSVRRSGRMEQSQFFMRPGHINVEERSWYDEMYQKLYEDYHLAADRNHTLIADVGKKFYELSDKVNLYADDGCHPNEKGSQIAAEIIAEVLMN